MPNISIDKKKLLVISKVLLLIISIPLIDIIIKSIFVFGKIIGSLTRIIY